MGVGTEFDTLNATVIFDTRNANALVAVYMFPTCGTV